MRREIVVVDDVQFERSEVGLARQLAGCPGVIQVDVDPRAGLADIIYEESRTTPNRLREFIAQCGYTVRGEPPRTAPPPRVRAVGPTARAEQPALAG